MEKYKLYNEKVELCFNPARHIYTVNNVPVDGVTSVVKIIDKSSVLMTWAVNKTVEYVKEHLKAGQSLDEIEIEDLLYNASGQHHIFKKKAGDVGTLIHDWIHKWAKGENPPLPVNQQIRNGVNAFLQWSKDNKAVFHHSEKKVYSQQYNYAGTLDFEGTVNGKLAIVDFKTSKGIYSEMRYQVAAYQQAREEETGQKYEERWIIRFGKELNRKGELDFETQRMDDYEKDLKAFLAALVLWRREKELKGMISPSGVDIKPQRSADDNKLN